MKPSRSYLQSYFAAAICLLLGLSGCSSDEEGVQYEVPTNLTKPQEEALVQRVEGKWRAMEAWDYGAAYEYTTPNYRRIFPKHLYSKNFSEMLERELTEVEVLTYDADAAVASVAVRVMSKPIKFTSAASKAIGALPATIFEQWILIDGQWWYSVKV